MGPKTGGRALAWCSSSSQPPTSRQSGQTASTWKSCSVWLRRAICGEQVLQGGGIEMLVLHAVLTEAYQGSALVLRWS
jgi:hypothetical protein